MSELTGQSITLRDLYRRSQPGCVDADTLVRFAAGEFSADAHAEIAARLAALPGQDAVVRLLAELQPDSARLAASITAADAPHQRVSRHISRHAIHAPRARRGLRWLAAAAVLVAVAGLWSAHHVIALEGMPAVVASPNAALPQVDDGIFGSGMDGRIAATSHDDDVIFRATFPTRS